MHLNDYQQNTAEILEKGLKKLVQEKNEWASQFAW